MNKKDANAVILISSAIFIKTNIMAITIGQTAPEFGLFDTAKNKITKVPVTCPILSK